MNIMEDIFDMTRKPSWRCETRAT